MGITASPILIVPAASWLGALFGPHSRGYAGDPAVQTQSAVQSIRPFARRHDVVERPKLTEWEADSTRSGERMISAILFRCSVPHSQSGINARASVVPNAVIV